MTQVDVLVPTLRRPDGLGRALRSLFSQDRAAELIAAVVVVRRHEARLIDDAKRDGGLQS